MDEEIREINNERKDGKGTAEEIIAKIIIVKVKSVLTDILRDVSG